MDVSLLPLLWGIAREMLNAAYLKDLLTGRQILSVWLAARARNLKVTAL
jgi:hypothetical protein